MSLQARSKKVLEEAACVVGLYRHELPRARIYNRSMGTRLEKERPPGCHLVLFS